MKIKSQRDFFAGLMFLVVGAAFALGARSYTVGSAARMGPGYFPMLLGILLAVLGLAIVFYSMVHNPAHGTGGDKIGSWAWKPVVFVLGANVLFGAALGGLPSIKLPSLGLVIAIFLLVGVSGLADASNQPRAMLKGLMLAVPITAVGLSLAAVFPRFLGWMGTTPYLLLCVALTVAFTYGFFEFLLPTVFMRLQGSQKFQKAMMLYAGVAFVAGLLYVLNDADQTKLAAGLGFLAEIEFKIILAVALIVLIPKLAPKVGLHDHNAVQLSLLISSMCFISVWAFIDGLRLQIQMWPMFVTG